METQEFTVGRYTVAPAPSPQHPDMVAVTHPAKGSCYYENLKDAQAFKGRMRCADAAIAYYDSLKVVEVPVINVAKFPIERASFLVSYVDTHVGRRKRVRGQGSHEVTALEAWADALTKMETLSLKTEAQAMRTAKYDLEQDAEEFAGQFFISKPTELQVVEVLIKVMDWLSDRANRIESGE